MSIENAEQSALERSQLLISFANVASDPRPSCLLHMDFVTQQTRWLDVGLGRPLVSGVGVCADDRFVYHLFVEVSDFRTHVTVLDRRSLEVLFVQALPEIDDGHSIVRFGDDLVVVSTGTDQIFAYPVNGQSVGDPRLLWSPSGTKADTHHVNSVAVANGQLFCSAFGPRDDDSWYTPQNGYIRNLSRDEIVVDGLRQPHSTAWNDEELYFCNSLEGTVNTCDSVVAYLCGYSRGLAFGSDGTIYTGTVEPAASPGDRRTRRSEGLWKSKRLGRTPWTMCIGPDDRLGCEPS